MVFLKRVGVVLGLALAALVLPPLAYGLATGDGDNPGWITGLSVVLLLLVILGGVIYLAVDAAMRHNR